MKGEMSFAVVIVSLIYFQIEVTRDTVFVEYVFKKI